MTCSFVPPYLLRHAADSGARADTLRLDQQLRARREGPVPTQRPTATVEGGRRVVHDAQHQETLPGVVVRQDGDPASGDVAVDEAFTSSGQVWDLFAQVFGRESFDGAASTVSVSVHYGTNYDNAFWDGEQLVFGDGDGEIFDRFTKPMDVLAHEFTHGVVQYTAALTYQGQSGALNESVADAFASMTKQQALGQQAGDADWLIGAGLFLPGVDAVALRSMVEPGTAYDDERLGQDPQVGSMADYVDTTDDNGGVHINSGIPNRAFALAAIGLGGHSWERAGQVWYDALTGGAVTAETDFRGFADVTIASADRLFADDAEVGAQVRAAWTTVGVLAAADPSNESSDEPEGDAGDAEPAPDPATGRVVVRRTGGFVGGVKAGELDLDRDPEGPEVATLLRRVDVRQITQTRTGADRFCYTLEYGEVQITVPEQDLTPELSQVVALVLGRRTPES